MPKGIIAIVACAFIALCYFALPSPIKGEIQIGELLPDAALSGLSVADNNLSAYRGKPLIINVWASWCGPCRDEMGSLQKLSQRAGGNQLNVIGISTDDYPEKASEFLQQSGTTFPNFIDKDLILEKMLGASRIPLTLLVDAEGRVIDKINGSQDWSSNASIELIRKALRVDI